MADTSKHARRRTELLQAARRVAGRHGLSGTNVRTVAAEAEVSSGSILYYFRSFDEVMYATVEGVLEEMYERRRELAATHSDPRERLVALIHAGVPDTISAELRMVYESIPLLREHPEYRPLHRSIVERQVALYRSAIEIGQALQMFSAEADVDVVARNLVALEDAYDLYPQIGVEIAPAVFRANILSYAALALGCRLDDVESA